VSPLFPAMLLSNWRAIPVMNWCTVARIGFDRRRALLAARPIIKIAPCHRMMIVDRPRRCHASSRSAKLRHCCRPNAESVGRSRCLPCKPAIRIRHVRMYPPRIGGHSFGRGRRRSSAMSPLALLPFVVSVNISPRTLFAARQERLQRAATARV